MNYYNPYFINVPTNGSLISRIFGNLKLSSILNGTNKALNFVNQTIPVIKQVSPMIKNVKTMFNVFNEFKKVDNNDVKKVDNNDVKKEVKTSFNKSINKPTFFI